MSISKVSPKSTIITIARNADMQTTILQMNQNFDAIWKAIKDITSRLDAALKQ